MGWIEDLPIVISNIQNFQNNMIRLSKLINEASVVELSELTPIQQKQIKAFESIIGGKAEMIWDGIHGFVVAIKLQNYHGAYRFDVDTMKKLIAAKARWVEDDLGNNISIGF